MSKFKKPKHELSTEQLVNKGMEAFTSSGFDFQKLMKDMRTNERHVITIYPDMMSGVPTIDGHRLEVDQIASEWWNKVYDMAGFNLVYKLQPGAVKVCCWYIARYTKGNEMSDAWQGWLKKADNILWQKDYKNCPLPPQKGDK